MLVDQVIISTVQSLKIYAMILMKKLPRLQLVGPIGLLLPPELHHFTVRIGVLSQHKRRAGRGTVLGHKPARLVSDPASVAEGLGAHGPSPPLWGLVGGAMQALPPFGAGAIGPMGQFFSAFFLLWFE